jgi:hypothetical protein
MEGENGHEDEFDDEADVIECRAHAAVDRAGEHPAQAFRPRVHALAQRLRQLRAELLQPPHLLHHRLLVVGPVRLELEDLLVQGIGAQHPHGPEGHPEEDVHEERGRRPGKMVVPPAPAQAQRRELLHHGAQHVGHDEGQQDGHDDFAHAPERVSCGRQQQDQHQRTHPSGTSFSHGYPLREIQMAMALQSALTA